MTRTLRRIALAAMLLAPFAALPAHAQTTTPAPTPENTTITNIATASWTDANGNTYAPAADTVNVMVGYKASPDVRSPASVTPPSPGSGAELAFTLINGGNGIDSLSVSTTAAAGVTITGYKLTVGAVTTTHANLAELNVALAGTPIAAGASVTVTTVYTVAGGTGGQTIPVSLTATSRRTPTAAGATDTSSTNVIPTVSGGVSVSPDGGSSPRLPSNGTQYSETFTVENTGNRADSYAVTVSAGSAITIVSVNGTPGTTASVNASPSAPGATVTVVYTVGDVPAGTTQNISVTAVSGNQSSVSDSGSRTVEVVRAAISVTKVAYLDDQTTAIGDSTTPDRVRPGQYIQYKITVTNNGGAVATLNGTGFGVTDALPSQVAYVTAAGDADGWLIKESGGVVTASLDETLGVGASRFFWIRVQIR